MLPKPTESIDTTTSLVEISISPNYGDQIGRGLASLLQYPYGCIEQTIASTLPNRLALSLSQIL